MRVGLELEVDGRAVRIERAVPRGPTAAVKLLPLLRDLSGAIVARASAQASAMGQPVTCREACAACCRQLVPVGRAEAERLREFVAAMPAKRRAGVLARFRAAQAEMRSAGLDRLREPARMSDGERARDARGDYGAVGLLYQRSHIDCPFLADERCAIYPERPLACREHLVTSAPEHCGRPELPGVEGLGTDGLVFEALAAIDAPAGAEPDWIPLPYALEWVPAPRSRPGTGPELFHRALAALRPRRLEPAAS